MAKALERGVIDNAADAGRLEDAYRLAAKVLLKDDPRVQAAYGAFEERVTTTDPQLWDLLWRLELTALAALVVDLGLRSEARWLIGAMFWEFCRTVGTDPIELKLPEDVVAELEPGRAPKHGETHCEDLERNIRWWYRRKVKRPSDPIKQIAREYVETRRALGRTDVDAGSDIRHGIRRAEQLFACLRAGNAVTLH